MRHTAHKFELTIEYMLRVQGRIPVVVMGETGCGKTSLVKFLSMAVDANFKHLDFHAGITADNIQFQ
jgi:E3 ubiquitin-protein ligase RNF213